MEKFAAASFYSLLKIMADLRNVAEQEIKVGGVEIATTEQTREGLKDLAIELKTNCHKLGLKISAKAAHAVWESIGDGASLNVKDFHASMKQFEQNVHWEMEDVSFFYLPAMRSDYYDQKQLFGEAVSGKFTTIQYDMVEAGNCYAMGRSTGCVFHLMRIMEVGVQQFGTKLGVAFADAKNWHNILEETDKAIKKLPSKGPDTSMP
jgi:hypothetical protein